MNNMAGKRVLVLTLLVLTLSPSMDALCQDQGDFVPPPWHWWQGITRHPLPINKDGYTHLPDEIDSRMFTIGDVEVGDGIEVLAEQFGFAEPYTINDDDIYCLKTEDKGTPIYVAFIDARHMGPIVDNLVITDRQIEPIRPEQCKPMAPGSIPVKTDLGIGVGTTEDELENALGQASWTMPWRTVHEYLYSLPGTPSDVQYFESKGATVHRVMLDCSLGHTVLFDKGVSYAVGVNRICTLEYE